MNTNTADWFKNRGFEARQYQIEILDTLIPESFKNNEIPTVLADCPSAGKTVISIKAIEDYLKNYPSSRVLVLTHGTTLLRTQYNKEITDLKPDFNHCMIDSGKDFNSSTAQVVITLPQTIRNLTKIGKFDLVVVDESSQAEGRKYNSLTEWQKKSLGSYKYAVKQPWWKEFNAKQFHNARR